MTTAQIKMATSSDSFIRLCDLDDLDEDEPYRAEVDGVGYAVFKVGDQVFVTADQCTHGPGLLSDGFVEGFEIECPFHQGKFDLRTGMPTAPPCEVPVATWVPVIADDGVYIDIANPNQA